MIGINQLWVCAAARRDRRQYLPEGLGSLEVTVLFRYLEAF